MFLTGSTALLGGGGLAFWATASRIYGIGEVGLAITIVSGLTLVSGIAACGWPQLATRDAAAPARASRLMRRSVGVAVTLAISLTLVIAWVPEHFGLALDDVSGSLPWIAAICLVTTSASATNACLDGSLIAQRASHFVAIEAAANVATRFAVMILLRGHGATGLLLANAAASAAAAGLSFFFLHKQTRGAPPSCETPLRSDIEQAFWIGFPGIVSLVPMTVLPSVVLRELGAPAAAYFALALSVAYAVRLIPSVIAQTMLAEVGRGREPRPMLRGSLKTAGVASAVAFCAVVIVVGPGAHVIGSALPREAFLTFAFLALAGAMAGGNYVLDGMLLALHETAAFVLVNLVGTVVVFAAVVVGAQASLAWASAAYVFAEIVYAVVGWVVLSNTRGWRRSSEPAGLAVPT